MPAVFAVRGWGALPPGYDVDIVASLETSFLGDSTYSFESKLCSTQNEERKARKSIPSSVARCEVWEGERFEVAWNQTFVLDYKAHGLVA